MSAKSYYDTNNIVLAEFSNPSRFEGQPCTANGVTASLDKTSEGPNGAAIFSATNSGKVLRNAAWARLDCKFSPCINLKNHQAIGVWIEGDGNGQIIAIRLESPRHISLGAVADRYITIDFTGPRLITLVETESSRWSDYGWNDDKWLYNVYRETIDFGTVESLSIWYNNLPSDKQTKCIIGPIKAMPMMPCTLKNPVVTVNGNVIELPVEIRSGNYLEFNEGNDCILYGSKGEKITKVRLDNQVPVFLDGENHIRFSCDAVEGPAPRVKLTLIAHGEPL
jgi:hypothetical protein